MGDGTTGREKYRVSVVSSPEPMKFANRRNVAETSGRRRVKSRAYCSTSTESFAYPVMGPRAVMSSVNRAGSSALAPYTAVLDFMTSFLTVGTLWHAANSWSEPITLISDAHDVLDLGIALQALQQTTHQMARDARDQDPLAHRSTLPADAFDDDSVSLP